MRIISGTLRGKKLLTPKDDHIRPTADRAREAVYNIITSKLDEPLAAYDVLDIFSGTGAFGLEAASRGAKSVTFVDLDLTLTEKNAALCGFKNLKFIKADARKLSKARHPFGLIFTDAPYNKNLTEPTLQALLTQSYIQETSLVIAETAKDELLPPPDGMELVDERIYGAARFSFFKLKDK